MECLCLLLSLPTTAAVAGEIALGTSVAARVDARELATMASARDGRVRELADADAVPLRRVTDRFSPARALPGVVGRDGDVRRLGANAPGGREGDRGGGLLIGLVRDLFLVGD